MPQALYEISVGGTDVSAKFNPLLEQMSIELRAGHVGDTAQFVLSDVDGRVLLPSTGDPIVTLLGWDTSGISVVFTGTVEKSRSRGDRHGGRKIMIVAKGFDTAGKAKEHLEFHKDNASLADFMGAAAGKAGLSFAAHGDIGAIQRPYWVASTESFIHLGQRIADEVGAGFKIVGSTAYMWPRNSGLFGTGTSGGAIAAQAGVNLLDWDIVPTESRPRFAQSRSRYYDRAQAKWMETMLPIGLSGAQAIYTHRQVRGDADEAGQSATSNQREAEREAGSGDVSIVGEPAAQPDGTCAVIGARPGIDGVYRIDAVGHEFSRDGGFHTRLSLKQPQGSAGQDSRGG